MNLRLRSFTEADVLPIDRIWQEHWSKIGSLPSRHNAIIDAVVEGESGLVAYGQVKLFAEAMMFLDLARPKRERAQALKLLMMEAIRGTRKMGVEDLYAFIKDEEFAKLISQRYGFEIVESPGNLLLRRV